MQFLRRNQDRLRKAAVWVAVIIALRVAVRLWLDDSADSSVPGDSVVGLGVLLAVLLALAVITLGGFVWMTRNQPRTADVTLTATEERLWPERTNIHHPDDRDNHRTELDHIDFRHVGSIRAVLPDHTAVFAVSLGPDRHSVAITTPAHLSIVSDFDGKLLTTSNVHVEVGLRYRLSQSVLGGTAEELLAVHAQAIQVIIGQGGVPTRFQDDTVLDTVLDWERYGLAHHSSSHRTKKLLLGVALPGSGGPRPPITDSASARARVDQWLRSPDRWHPGTLESAND